MTDQDFQRWLREPSAARLLLVDLHHAEGVERVANGAYITHPDDDPPNTPYLDVLSEAVDITQRLDAQPSWGDLALIDDGQLAHWRAYQWRGHEVVMRLGSPDWPLRDFRVIARQQSGGILSADRDRLTLGLYDRSALLDQPIEREALPNGEAAPLVLGRVFCAPAVRVDSQSLLYRVSWLPVTRLVVRDGNGPEIAHTSRYATGSFIARAYSPRALCCDVVEPHQTPAQIVQWVAAQYGLSVHSGGAAQAETLPEITLGLRYDGEVTGRQILDDVCQAIGGYWSIDINGQLRVQRLTMPEQVDLTLAADDLEQGSIQLDRLESPWRSLTLRYDRNYAPMNDIAGSIQDNQPALVERLSEEWRAVTRSLDDVTTEDDLDLNDFPLAQPKTLSTVLTQKAEAEQELIRRLRLHAKRREVWSMTAFLPPFELSPGVAVRVRHPALAERIGRVISVSASPTSGRTSLEIWY